MVRPWLETRLGDVLTLQRGFDLPYRSRRRGSVPVVTSSGVEDVHDTAMVKAPGVVTGRYGTIGNVFTVMSDFWPLNTTLFVADFKGHSPSFVAHLLRTIDFDSHSGKSGVPGVNRNDLHEEVVRVPSTRQEEDAIASALDEGDQLTRSLEHLLAKKRAIKQGAMQSLLTGAKRLPGFTAPWEQKTFGQLFAFSGGHSASRDQLSTLGHCYLHYGDIHTSTQTLVDMRQHHATMPKLEVSLADVTPSALLDDGDVVFVDASEDVGGTSKHVVVVNPDRIPLISGLHTIVAKPRGADLDRQYCRFCFQTRAIAKQFRFYAVGTKVLGVSKGNIGKIQMPVPPVLEQAAIAEVLADLDADLDATTAKLDKARAVKQGMMQELLTGRIRLV